MGKLSLAIALAAACCLVADAGTGAAHVGQARLAGCRTLNGKVPRLAEQLHRVKGYVRGVSGRSTSRDIDTTYDNTANPSGFTAGFLVGTEFGDELKMTGQGRLASFSFSIANSSSEDLYSVDVELKFYDVGMSFIASYDLGTVSFFGPGGLPAGGWATTINDIDLAAAGIYLPMTVVCTQIFTNPVGSGAITDDIGPLLYDPPTVGASEDYFYWNGGWWWFGSNPVANFYYKLRVEDASPPVPPVYDNSTGLAQAGFAVAEGNWLGDDLTFEDYGDPPTPSWALNHGMLDKLQWTFWNCNAAANPAGVVSADWTVEFFDPASPETTLSSYTWNLDYGGSPLQAGYYTHWVAEGLKDAAAIALNRSEYGIRFRATNVEWEAGKTPGQIGQIFYWRPSVGHSDDRVWVNGAWLYYPGNTNDFLYRIDVLPWDKGDMNCDGVINNFDINPFVTAIAQGQAAYEAAYPDCDYLNGDVDGNGSITGFDIDPFIALLAN